MSQLCAKCGQSESAMIHHDPASPKVWEGWHKFVSPSDPKAGPETKDCICPTVMDGPNYSLEILPECNWHNRPEPASKPGESLDELHKQWEEGYAVGYNEGMTAGAGFRADPPSRAMEKDDD